MESSTVQTFVSSKLEFDQWNMCSQSLQKKEERVSSKFQIARLKC